MLPEPCFELALRCPVMPKAARWEPRGDFRRKARLSANRYAMQIRTVPSIVQRVL